MLSLALALIPISMVAGARAFFGTAISYKEIIISALLSVCLGYGLVMVGKGVTLSHIELLNGEITGTTKTVDRYSESYDCNPKTDKKGNTTYETCWEYGYDLAWTAQSGVGTFDISSIRCDTDIKSYCIRRYPDPERWTQIEIGDPVTTQHRYDNYVKAAGYGLFNRSGSDDLPKSWVIPTYPLSIKDHYHVDRVIPVGMMPKDTMSEWNTAWHEMLKTLGPTKHANAVLIMVADESPQYAEAVINQWGGGNKNDILIFAGFSRGDMNGGATWVKAHSWAMSDRINIELRDQLLMNPAWSSPDTLTTLVHDIVTEHYVRRPMKDFEYLASEIHPSGGMIALFAVIGFLFGTGLIVVAVKYDI